MKNFSYWNKFYGYFHQILPIQPAIFIANEYQGEHHLIDFRFGSGKDIFF